MMTARARKTVFHENVTEGHVACLARKGRGGGGCLPEVGNDRNEQSLLPIG